MKKQRIRSSIVLLATMLFFLTTWSFAADPCDRACLENTIDNVIAAMIAHNPDQLMMAKDVLYTENGVALRPGDGMWGTLTERGKYNLYVSDPEAGQAGFYGTVIENGRLNYIALRVKIVEALIEEIETIVVRPEGMNTSEQTKQSVGEKMDEKTVRPQFLQTVPPKNRMSREKLTEIANAYFMGLANQTGNFTAPFCETCERWENGLHTTHQAPSANLPTNMPDILSMGCEDQQKSGWFSFVTEIRDRRFPIVDVERGLVIAFAFFDHDAAVREYPLPDGSMTPNVITFPQTIHISELFQIRDGKIDQIEAVINTVPYGMRTEIWDE